MAQELKCRNCQYPVEYSNPIGRPRELRHVATQSIFCAPVDRYAELDSPKPLTLTQALEAFKEMFPERAGQLNVERICRIGDSPINDFFLWDRDEQGSMHIVSQSSHSFEHALAIVKSGNEQIWPEDRREIEETV